MKNIYAMRPVNKISAVVVNQCGCATQLEFNSLLDEREQLKNNTTIWMRQSAQSRGLRIRNKPLIRAANTELARLNKKLKPYDEWHRSETPKDYDHAFRMEVKRIFGNEIFNQIDMRARELV